MSHSSGWHQPQLVYGLAVLWERFPDLRDRNVLERVLDYWVEAIARCPAPVTSYGKGGLDLDNSPESHGFTVAALHAGHQSFGKPEYLAARDAMLDSMRGLPLRPPDNPYYEAMAARTRWRSIPDSSHLNRDAQNMCEFVSVYGQTCAFIGNGEELEETEEWIRSALTREDGYRLFDIYSRATFSQRCGMISILRGRAAYLAAPELQDAEASDGT